jgi:hypothetical protein
VGHVAVENGARQDRPNHDFYVNDDTAAVGRRPNKADRLPIRPVDAAVVGVVQVAHIYALQPLVDPHVRRTNDVDRIGAERNARERHQQIRLPPPDPFVEQAKPLKPDRDDKVQHDQITADGTVQYPLIRNEVFIPGKLGLFLCFDSYIISGHRIVHFDLKGAAPKVDYFIDLIRLVKQLGGTGLLIEWEDTFPYEGGLTLSEHRCIRRRARGGSLGHSLHQGRSEADLANGQGRKAGHHPTRTDLRPPRVDTEI